MITEIILIGIIITFVLLILINREKWKDGTIFTALFGLAIISFIYGSIITTDIESKYRIEPTIVVKTEIKNSIVVSDTTYIYKKQEVAK